MRNQNKDSSCLFLPCVVIDFVWVVGSRKSREGCSMCMQALTASSRAWVLCTPRLRLCFSCCLLLLSSSCWPNASILDIFIDRTELKEWELIPHHQPSSKFEYSKHAGAKCFIVELRRTYDIIYMHTSIALGSQKRKRYQHGSWQYKEGSCFKVVNCSSRSSVW